MRFTSLLRKTANYQSVIWHESTAVKGVQFATRRVSLAQRIELTHKARELSLKYEFMKAGEPSDQVEASLADLLVRRLYLEWGLVELRGLTIDGQRSTSEALIEKGPEPLSDEIINTIRAELELSEEEIKNS
jgi:hypothetical protein